MKKHGPLFMFALKRRLAAELSAKGKSPREVRSLLAEVDASLVENVCATLPQVTAAMADLDKAAAIGDGTIIKLILQFLQSDLGKQLIQTILALLLAFI